VADPQALLRGREAAGIEGVRFNLALNGKGFEPCL
jgi:hypothetical protein